MVAGRKVTTKKKTTGHLYLLALLEPVSRRREIERIVREGLQQSLGDDFTLIVVDVSRNVGVMEEEGILAVPALIRKKPEPRKVLVGALDNVRHWRERLGLLHPIG